MQRSVEIKDTNKRCIPAVSASSTTGSYVAVIELVEFE
jgi:hypothetical protein